MENIALDTAACQKCLESASSFGSMTTCFSKLAIVRPILQSPTQISKTCSLEISKLAENIDICYFFVI